MCMPLHMPLDENDKPKTELHFNSVKIINEILVSR